jgi:hypothetical protein
MHKMKKLSHAQRLGLIKSSASPEELDRAYRFAEATYRDLFKTPLPEGLPIEMQREIGREVMKQKSPVFPSQPSTEENPISKMLFPHLYTRQPEQFRDLDYEQDIDGTERVSLKGEIENQPTNLMKGLSTGTGGVTGAGIGLLLNRLFKPENKWMLPAIFGVGGAAAGGYAGSKPWKTTHEYEMSSKTV